MESNEYSKLLTHIKGRCCYNPSESSKKRVLNAIKKKKRKPLVYSFASVAAVLVIFFSANFLANNYILIQPKTDVSTLIKAFNGERENVESKLSLSFNGENTETASFDSQFGDKMSSSFGFLNDDTSSSLPNMVVDSVY